ncbi:MAG: hypothetical protein AB2421_06405 [Thermotaleaceae bacterium]
MSYDQQIDMLQQQKQKIIDQMEIKKEAFLDELANFTISWFEKHTLSAIKENAEKVIELGEDKARELKGKIKELTERTPELVKQYMDEKHLWWHTNLILAAGLTRDMKKLI